MWTEGQTHNQIRYVFLFGSMEWKWSLNHETRQCVYTAFALKNFFADFDFGSVFARFMISIGMPQKRNTLGEQTSIPSSELKKKYGYRTYLILGHSDFLNLANASSEPILVPSGELT